MCTVPLRSGPDAIDVDDLAVGDKFTCKGQVSGFLANSITLDPAMIVAVSKLPHPPQPVEAGFVGAPYTKEQRDLTKIKADSTGFTPEMTEAFRLMSQVTDLRRDQLQEQLRGRVLQWRLKVGEVQQAPGNKVRIWALDNDGPTVFCMVRPETPGEKEMLAGLKVGDIFECKGVVSGFLMRGIEVEPAVMRKGG